MPFLKTTLLHTRRKWLRGMGNRNSWVLRVFLTSVYLSLTLVSAAFGALIFPRLALNVREYCWKGNER